MHVSTKRKNTSTDEERSEQERIVVLENTEMRISELKRHKMPLHYFTVQMSFDRRLEREASLASPG